MDYTAFKHLSRHCSGEIIWRTSALYFSFKLSIKSLFPFTSRARGDTEADANISSSPHSASEQDLLSLQSQCNVSRLFISNITTSRFWKYISLLWLIRFMRRDDNASISCILRSPLRRIANGTEKGWGHIILFTRIPLFFFCPWKIYITIC